MPWWLYERAGTVHCFVGLIETLLPPRVSMAKRILTPLDQLLAALQFFATGTFQSVVGNVLKLSKRSAGRSIHGVANALCKIAPQHIYMNPNLLMVRDD